MRIDQAERIVLKLDEMGHSAEVMENYSGMFGKQTIAITGDVPELAIGWAGAAVGVPWADMPQRRDAMGLGVVVY